VLASAFFIGIHLVISGTTLRDRFVAVIGEGGFLGFFSLLSILGMIWLVRGYAGAPLVSLWGPLPWFRPIALVLMLIAFLLVVVGLTTPTPTAVAGESNLDRAEPATGILRVSRHPFLCGVALWGITHLIANGDLASLILFGGLTILAAIGPRMIDGKRRRRFGDRWERFAAVTSVVPFAAIVQGRNELRLAEIGAVRVVLGVVLYVVFVWLHPLLFGTAPLF